MRWRTGSYRLWACSARVASRSTARSWSGWTGTTPRKAGRSWMGRGSPWSSRTTPWTVPPAAPPCWLPAPRPLREHERAIFLTGESRIMIQGITGSEGTKHGRRMLAAGTTVVGGTNPRKAGQTVDLGGTAVPVFGTVAETMAATGADVSVVFVPPAGAKSAVIEAIDAGIPLCIVITEGIPVHRSEERRVGKECRSRWSP